MSREVSPNTKQKPMILGRSAPLHRIDAVPLARDYIVDWERSHFGDKTVTGFPNCRHLERSGERAK